MIKGKIKKTEAVAAVNYRRLDALNQSMLKLFDTDPVKFYEEFKLGKTRDVKKSTAIVIGDIVDFYLLSCRGDEDVFHNRFDEKYALFSGDKGTGQVFILADKLFDLTVRDTEDDKLKGSFEDRFSEAVIIIQRDGKYKGKTEDKILEDFEKNGLEYFQMMVDNIGKTVVDTSLVDKALSVGNKMKNDEFTKFILNFSLIESKDDGMEILTHLPIQWQYVLRDGRIVDCKSEVDILVIDHTGRTVQMMDLKTSYDNESFDYMYIKNSYYLQNAFYSMAIKFWLALQGMEDYMILPSCFIVGDTSSNNRRPLIYETSEEDIIKGSIGFDLRGNHYRGVMELIEEIGWCEDKNIWDCSRESYENMGQMKLEIKYDS